jgi:hypothetical protein
MKNCFYRNKCVPKKIKISRKERKEENEGREGKETVHRSVSTKQV